jgi:hypothetical protein
VACSARNKTPDAAPDVLLLYGHGDGGGGPTDEMVQRLLLVQDVDGLGRVTFGGPDEYFHAAAARVNTAGSAALPVWRGELYLELHRGTLTSQQQLKKLNRRCEHALHDAEAAGALAVAFGASARDGWRLDAAWKAVLLNQFHDVLPGSCTADVVADASSSYIASLAAAAEVIIDALTRVGSPVSWCNDQLGLCDPTLAAALADSEADGRADSSPSAVVAFNSLSVERRELVCVPSYCCSPSISQSIASGSHLQWAMCKFSALSLAPISICTPSAPTSVSKTATGFILQHSALKVHVSNAGIITSCSVWDAGLSLWRESVRSGGGIGKLQLFKDVPLFWDAWDIEFYYDREPLQDVVCSNGSVAEAGPLLCSVRFDAKIGLNSRAEIVYSLRADDPFVRMRFNVHWAESHSLLRVSFDSSVDADEWLADSQFSVISRSSRRNTSWDRAKFEAAAHKWIAVREHGMMVAVINDGVYGHSCLGGTLSSSLLRSPTHPDPAADRGNHVFNMAFMPSPAPSAVELVIAAARSFNAPVTTFKVPSVHADDAGQLPSLQLGFASTCGQVVVDTVKLPFAWTASKLQFESPAHSPCTPASPSDPVHTPAPAAFVTPPNSAQQPPQSDVPDADLAVQEHSTTPTTSIANSSPAAMASAAAVSPVASHVSDSSRTIETPPLTSYQFNTPSDTPPIASPHRFTPPTAAAAAAALSPAIPPGTRVIIVRLFEAAGGAAPSVGLRSCCRSCALHAVAHLLRAYAPGCSVAWAAVISPMEDAVIGLLRVTPDAGSGGSVVDIGECSASSLLLFPARFLFQRAPAGRFSKHEVKTLAVAVAVRL